MGEAYNPYTGAYGATRQGSNAYGSWGQSVVSKNGNTAYTQHASNAYGSAGTVQTSQGGKGAATSTAYGNTAAGKTANGDMYAGHDGNVYKNTGSGWQTYNNGSWNNVQKPTTTSAQSYDQQHPTSTNPNYCVGPAEGPEQSQLLGRPAEGAKLSTSSIHRDRAGIQAERRSYGDLNQEAQDRQRGAQQSQRFSQYQHSGGWGDDRWGGGGRSGAVDGAADASRLPKQEYDAVPYQGTDLSRAEDVQAVAEEVGA